MKFKLPLLEEEFNIETKEVKSTKTYLDCEFDFSIDAQQRWEENFPEQAKLYDVFDFVERMKNVEVKDVASAGIALKIIYCFLIFKDHITFREFTRMFDSTNEEYFNELKGILNDVLTYIFSRSDSKKK